MHNNTRKSYLSKEEESWARNLGRKAAAIAGPSVSLFYLVSDTVLRYRTEETSRGQYVACQAELRGAKGFQEASA